MSKARGKHALPQTPLLLRSHRLLSVLRMMLEKHGFAHEHDAERNERHNKEACRDIECEIIPFEECVQARDRKKAR